MSRNPLLFFGGCPQCQGTCTRVYKGMTQMMRFQVHTLNCLAFDGFKDQSVGLLNMIQLPQVIF